MWKVGPDNELGMNHSEFNEVPYFKHHNPLLHWLLARGRFLLEPSAADLA